jgi:hypothetical protein
MTLREVVGGGWGVTAGGMQGANWGETEGEEAGGFMEGRMTGQAHVGMLIGMLDPDRIALRSCCPGLDVGTGSGGAEDSES